MGWGNLLLLSDKPKEANKAFEAAYRISPEKQLAAATEALARAMRAEDGNVERANAWVLSLRPAAPSNPTSPAASAVPAGDRSTSQPAAPVTPAVKQP
jgi:hypothetical protein